MASIVITALRDGDGPCSQSLGAAGLARDIADRLGATVIASLSLNDGDDLDGWVAAFGAAGVDRIACARSEPGQEPSHSAVQLEMVRRLAPRLVLVPASDDQGIADAVAAALDVSVCDNADLEWSDEGNTFGGVALDGEAVIVASVDLEPPAARGGEDIDVLFFDVEPDIALEPTDPLASSAP